MVKKPRETGWRILDESVTKSRGDTPRRYCLRSPADQLCVYGHILLRPINLSPRMHALPVPSSSFAFPRRSLHAPRFALAAAIAAASLITLPLPTRAENLDHGKVKD